MPRGSNVNFPAPTKRGGERKKKRGKGCRAAQMSVSLRQQKGEKTWNDFFFFLRETMEFLREAMVSMDSLKKGVPGACEKKKRGGKTHTVSLLKTHTHTHTHTFTHTPIPLHTHLVLQLRPFQGVAPHLFPPPH